MDNILNFFGLTFPEEYKYLELIVRSVFAIYILHELFETIRALMTAPFKVFKD